MLRALEWETRRGMDALREWVDRLLWPMMMFVAAALLAQARPAMGLAPFAMGFLAAALKMDRQPLLVALGCLTGVFSVKGLQIAALAGAGVVLSGYAGARVAAGYLERFRRDAPPGTKRRGDGGLALLAALGVLIPAVPLASGSAGESLAAMLMAALSAVSAPFFRTLLAVRPDRRFLMPEERVGWMLFLCAALAGLAALWRPAAIAMAAVGILTLAPLGTGACACAGLMAGSAMLLSGTGLRYGAWLGGCGLAAGLSTERRRWVSSGALALAALAQLLTGLPAEDWAGLTLAAACMPLVPEEHLRKLREWTAGETRGACDPDRLARKLRHESERKLRAMSEAFGELSEGYRLEVDMPDEQTLIGEMRLRLCERCSGYEQCWAGDDNRAVRFLCQLISRSIEWANGDHSQPLFGEEAPPEWMRMCRRGRSIPARLGEVLEEFARKRRTEMKRGAVNQLISAQFMQAQLLLRGLADAQARPVSVRGRYAARARAALDRTGIPTSEVIALRGVRQMEIIATLQRGCWSSALARRAAAGLSQVFGRCYEPGAGMGAMEMKFLRMPTLGATAAASCHSARAGVPSGDSHIIRLLEGDRLLLMISDGMGSGEAAARESAHTLRLLNRFLAADVEKTLALETVNELMLARTDADMFATVDLCVVDLANGTAEFTKLAAAGSMILRGGEVMTVEGGRLPLGILERVQPSVTRVRLEPGDVIFMASDGIMDGVDGGILRDCLIANGARTPDVLAEQIVDAVERWGEARHRDDMTVICARVTQRRSEYERAG